MNILLNTDLKDDVRMATYILIHNILGTRHFHVLFPLVLASSLQTDKSGTC